MNGMTDSSGLLIYLDTNPFIYLVEGTRDIARPVEQLMKLLRRKPKVGVTSELTLAEVLPKAPSPNHRRIYLNLILWSSVFELVPVSRGILFESARYRRHAARKQHDGSISVPKLPDAIHVVSALECGSRAIVSNDARLLLPRQLRRFSSDATSIAALMQELA